MAKIKLDLHDIFKKGLLIDEALNRSIAEVINNRIVLLEILTGKGNGELKKRVLRFLDQPRVRKLYHRVENDDKDFGHVLVHFRPQSNRAKIGLCGHPGKLPLKQRSF